MSVLTRVQINPRISTNNAAYVAELVERAKRFVITFCGMNRFPELSQGYLTSGASPSTDISALSTDSFYISVNCSNPISITLNLAVCTTGEDIATELQRAIRDNTHDGFDEVTVSFANNIYTITSGRYGEKSSIKITFAENTKHVSQALKISNLYGATEYFGAEDNLEIQDATVALVENLYNKLGLEGLSSGSVPGGMSFAVFADDPFIKPILLSNRKFKS